MSAPTKANSLPITRKLIRRQRFYKNLLTEYSPTMSGEIITVFCGQLDCLRDYIEAVTSSDVDSARTILQKRKDEIKKNLNATKARSHTTDGQRDYLNCKTYELAYLRMENVVFGWQQKGKK